ncbi:unnamed protein product [Gongylonema pulchrum]|uniref:Uncharacterized protein n=1 Tax=Gongylonema pulchrum TaxID=637853 RepID=A0A183D0D8_9BILA|nr:unnamed protein product [Gongylonema pulchrum]
MRLPEKAFDKNEQLTGSPGYVPETLGKATSTIRSSFNPTNGLGLVSMQTLKKEGRKFSIYTKQCKFHRIRRANVQLLLPEYARLFGKFSVTCLHKNIAYLESNELDMCITVAVKLA